MFSLRTMVDRDELSDMPNCKYLHSIPIWGSCRNLINQTLPSWLSGACRAPQRNGKTESGMNRRLLAIEKRKI